MNFMTKFTILFLFVVVWNTFAADGVDLELLEESDSEILKEEIKESGDNVLNLSELEETDDLESLKNDIGDDFLADEKQKNAEKNVTGAVVNKGGGPVGKSGKLKFEIFDVGVEEKKLLEFSKFVEAKIPDKEWDEISITSKKEKYVVQDGDWLWRISQKLFGSGFYYSKVWALNPHITNPHEIEPGMVLVFDTGDVDSMPDIKLGEFEEGPQSNFAKRARRKGELFDFSKFGDPDDVSEWLGTRKKLVKQGVYFQYASEATLQSLAKLSQKSLNREYVNYEPPHTNIVIAEPGDNYDDSGFDKNSKISFNFNEGFFLNSFITSNVVVDFGKIVALKNEALFVKLFDTVYVELDSAANARPGDLFSVYIPEGRVIHKASNRSGYRYTIVAQLKVVMEKNDKWECMVTEVSGLVKRGDRITVYMSKINKISKTFIERNVEAIVMSAYREMAETFSAGDVVYLDRGRSDGVELGTVFETHDFVDPGTGKRITRDPTYKTGEITVITVTDNFSTGLITNNSIEIAIGNIALSKSPAEAAMDTRIRNDAMLKDVKNLEGNALDELDVELDLDDLSDDLLDKADRVQLTEDELEELERQEREKSIIKGHEADLKELERLERELVDVESRVNEAKVDEDRLLEQQNLNEIEKQSKDAGVDAFLSLDELEDEFGLKYMDQDLNSKENPYGMTEFDLEEVDELLNTKSE